jgi:hypothetical protein
MAGLHLLSRVSGDEGKSLASCTLTRNHPGRRILDD